MNTLGVENAIPNKLASFGHLVTDRTVITGGHFILKGNKPELNAGTIESFKSAVSLYKKAKDSGKNVGLGILINDIGMTCDTNVCYVVDVFDRKSFTLPPEYIDILNAAEIDLATLDIYWEKHLRNKGHAEFKKRIKKDRNIKKIDNDYWYVGVAGERLLLTRGKEGTPYGIAACPLIMATYAIEQEKRKWASSVNFYYVDIDNHENVPNHFMIEKGNELAKHFKIRLDTKNIYFTHDKVMTNF